MVNVSIIHHLMEIWLTKLFKFLVISTAILISSMHIDIDMFLVIFVSNHHLSSRGILYDDDKML